MIKEEISKETNRPKTRLYMVFAWFVVTLVASMYTIKYPVLIGFTLLSLTFFIFNIFTTLYNLIIATTRRIVKDGSD